MQKAAVQAAMGAVPLMAVRAAGMETSPGDAILAVAVMGTVFAAPLGALAIKLVGERVLEPDGEPAHAALEAAAESP